MKIKKILERFAGQRVLVIGDVILDAYLMGDAQRISPEAPVPVVHVTGSEERLGGAANVALNLRCLGAEVMLAGVVGDDSGGECVKALLADAKIDARLLVVDAMRPTTRKTRVLARGYQLLRVDEEIQALLLAERSEALCASVMEVLAAGGVDVLLFQDYDKGVLAADLIGRLVSASRAGGVMVVADPKYRQFFDYRQVTLFKPNLKEFTKSMQLSPGLVSDRKQLAKAVTVLRRRLEAEEVLVTLSGAGMYAQSATKEHYEPAHRRQIVDVSGAGDAVISLAALGYAIGLPMAVRVALANLAGGLVCEIPGVVPITADALARHGTQIP